MSFADFLAQPEHGGRMHHVAAVDGNRILGVLRINTALSGRTVGMALSAVTLREIMSRNFTRA